MFVEGKPRTIFYPPDALITAFVAMVQKITTYALAAHDPGSAQDGRMSNNFCTPGMHLFLLTLTSMQRTADETIMVMMVMLEMIMVMMGVMRIMVVMMGVVGVMGVVVGGGGGGGWFNHYPHWAPPQSMAKDHTFPLFFGNLSLTRHDICEWLYKIQSTDWIWLGENWQWKHIIFSWFP